ncbi:DUF2158 domain-containing protein [Chromobacterium violaceum]|uniref:YodC family protein n=2 Tax=Chromobacteriaceae TaxID=1499392 RepID=UPI00195246EA|nr:DUF2158 domain-containing protein [Chromobacterium violaceum]QRQ16053.1 DUF2158 domain-containing protein [Chromobacterium violaceum]
MGLRVGDIVRLRSGGPKMTVESVNSPGLKGMNFEMPVACTWFNDRGVRERAVFEATSLIKV